MKKLISTILALSIMMTMCIPAFAASGKLGDVNGDNKISAVDARMILQSVAGLLIETEQIKTNGDVNGDNKITAVDARMILQIVAGLENSHTHTYECTVIKEPSCIEKGIKSYTCECGSNYVEDVPALGHTIVIDAAVAPTISSTGLTEGSHCSVCDKVLIVQEIIPKYSPAENSNIDCYHGGGLNGTYKTYAVSSNTVYNEYVIENVEILKEDSTNGTFNLTVVMTVRIVNQITGPNAIRGEWLLSSNGNMKGGGVYSRTGMVEGELYEISFSKYHLEEGDYKLTFSSVVG